MKKVVHGLLRRDFSILVEICIENLTKANDYRSSLVPEILIKHFNDLLPRDQQKLVNKLHETIVQWEEPKTEELLSLPDQKYWKSFLEQILTDHPKLRPVTIRWQFVTPRVVHGTARV